MKIEEQLNSFWNDNSYPEYGGFTYFDIFYIDTDRIIHQNDLDFGDIRFKIIEVNIEYLKTNKIKKMVYLYEDKIHSKAYGKNKKDTDEVNSIVSEIRTQKRSDKIDSLGIF
jgi:hypothetical protein